jgi:peptide chain release factor 1
VRPAAGGDEAGLFAAELLKCYMLYASRQWWTTEMIDNQLTDVGGVKNCTIKIAGESVYSKLKRESWVHRVQRIPSTESQGRVHTSTITVAIMPEVEEIDAVIDMADIEMDTYAASSSWGQNANKNQTWVRLRHKPTGIIVNIWDTKSQLKNKERAFSILRSRLYQLEIEKIQADQKDVRSAQIGNGDRSEKIRTYNYPQDRITDHRLKESRSNLPVVMQGNIDDIIVACTMYFQAQFLSESVS